MPGWRIRAAGRSGLGLRIRGEASSTPEREPSWMGGPARHAHTVEAMVTVRPARTARRPAVPPRPVVAAGLEPGPVPGRADPGAARRRSSCWSLSSLARPTTRLWPFCAPSSRVPRGAAAHRDPPPPAAGHRRGGDTGAAGHTRPAEPTGDRRGGPRAATWRQLGYHLLAAPALAVAAIVAFGVWLAGILFALVYAYAWTLPAGSLLHRGQSAPLPGHLPPFSTSRWTST